MDGSWIYPGDEFALGPTIKYADIRWLFMGGPEDKFGMRVLSTTELSVYKRFPIQMTLFLVFKRLQIAMPSDIRKKFFSLLVSGSRYWKMTIGYRSYVDGNLAKDLSISCFIDTLSPGNCLMIGRGKSVVHDGLTFLYGFGLPAHADKFSTRHWLLMFNKERTEVKIYRTHQFRSFLVHASSIDKARSWVKPEAIINSTCRPNDGSTLSDRWIPGVDEIKGHGTTDQLNTYDDDNVETIHVLYVKLHPLPQ